MKRLITIIILVIVVIGGYFLISGNTADKTETISLENELNPLNLTDEEKEILRKEDLILSGDDELTRKLKTVRTGDDIESIEKDLNDTNFLDLDKEFAALEKLLKGL